MNARLGSVEDTDIFTGTCDMGYCDRPTVALIQTPEGWLSSCGICALSALTNLTSTSSDGASSTGTKGDS